VLVGIDGKVGASGDDGYREDVKGVFRDDVHDQNVDLVFPARKSRLYRLADAYLGLIDDLD
jgi:hypothetical protein